MGCMSRAHKLSLPEGWMQIKEEGRKRTPLKINFASRTLLLILGIKRNGMPAMYGKVHFKYSRGNGIGLRGESEGFKKLEKEQHFDWRTSLLALK